MTQGEQKGNKHREEHATSRNSVYGIVDSHLSAAQLCSVSSFGGRQHPPYLGTHLRSLEAQRRNPLTLTLGSSPSLGKTSPMTRKDRLVMRQPQQDRIQDIRTESHKLRGHRERCTRHSRALVNITASVSSSIKWGL